MGTLLDIRLGLHELLRTPLGRSSDDLTRWPLVDSSYGRTDKTNRDNLRRCHRSSPTRREHRLQGKQGARGPPLPEVGPRHATLRADRAGSRGWVPGAARLLQWWRVHGRVPRASLLRSDSIASVQTPYSTFQCDRPTSHDAHLWSR